MSHEQLSDHVERRSNPESHHELQARSKERLDELTHSADNEHDTSGKRAEAAREAIRHHNEAQPEPEPVPAAETQKPEPKLPYLSLKLNYRQTMNSMQQKLTPASRSFSKVIHAPVIEVTSEVLERTVARPSIANGALWTALIVGSVFYFTARHFGYMLSGSEMLFSFVVGAVLGLVLEAVWRTLRRGK
jgi:hypothetical protein